MVEKTITRRGLLKLLPAVAASPLIPVEVDGEVHGAALKVTPRFFMVFVDVQAVDLNQIGQMPIPVPDVEMEFIAVRLRYGQTIEDAVKIYEVSGPSSLSEE